MEENKQHVLDNVAKIQNYSEKIDEIKKLSGSSFEDLVPNYVLNSGYHFFSSKISKTLPFPSSESLTTKVKVCSP